MLQAIRRRFGNHLGGAAVVFDELEKTADAIEAVLVIEWLPSAPVVSARTWGVSVTMAFAKAYPCSHHDGMPGFIKGREQKREG